MDLDGVAQALALITPVFRVRIPSLPPSSVPSLTQASNKIEYFS